MSEELFPISHPECGDALCDKHNYAILKEKGWTKEGEEAAPAAPLSTSGEIRLADPGSVTLHGLHTLSLEQHIHGGGELGYAAVQFSNNEDGPWLTAQEEQGAVTAPVIPYNAQNPAFNFPDVAWHDHAWVRVGAWAGDPHTNEPVLVSNAVKPKTLAEAALAPEPNDRS